MQWLWTWDGRSFGYRRNDLLFTKNGNNVGYFADEEVYSTHGNYLGELKNGRLITKNSSRHKRSSTRVPTIGTSFADKVDYVGYAMYAGYEDFPEID